MSKPELEMNIPSEGKNSSVEGYVQKLQEEGEVLIQLMDKIKSSIQQALNESTGKNIVIEDLDKLLEIFSQRYGEAEESRDARLKSLLEFLQDRDKYTWNQPVSRTLRVISSGGHPVDIESRKPITPDEIIDLPPTNRQREIRLLLVYGITHSTITQVMNMK